LLAAPYWVLVLVIAATASVALVFDDSGVHVPVAGQALLAAVLPSAGAMMLLSLVFDAEFFGAGVQWSTLGSPVHGSPIRLSLGATLGLVLLGSVVYFAWYTFLGWDRRWLAVYRTVLRPSPQGYYVAMDTEEPDGSASREWADVGDSMAQGGVNEFDEAPAPGVVEAFRVAGLSKTYPGKRDRCARLFGRASTECTAVQSVSCELYKGQVVGIVGSKYVLECLERTTFVCVVPYLLG
jgi:hypothetical protein